MFQPNIINEQNKFNHIDPRIKIIHAILSGVLLFTVHTNLGILINAFFMAIILIFLKLYSCAGKLATYTAILFVLTQIINILPKSFMAIFGIAIFMFFKFAPVLGLYYIMTKSISASELVNALEKMKLPRSVTITLAVTLRFMPTIFEELTIIKNSLKIRRVPLTLLSVLKKPMMMTELVIVPLMMRFLRVAEELSAAAVVRGIENPEKRSSMFLIKIRKQDILYLNAVICYSIFLFAFENGVIL